MTSDANLFQRPVHYHPIRQEVLHAWWDKDRDAMALHDGLKGFGMSFHAVSINHRHFEEKQYQAEREAERRRSAEGS